MSMDSTLLDVTSGASDLDTEAKALIEEDAKRGKHHDLATFKVSRPEKLRFIQYLLLRGATVRDVCRLAQVSATTVCQVTSDPEYGPPIAKQKARVTGLTKALLVVGLERKLEAWTAPDAKPPDVFDLKLLGDMVALADGGVTARVEHTHSFLSPSTSATMRLLEGSAVTTVGPWTESVHEAVVIGSDGQKLSTLPALSAPDPGLSAIETEPCSTGKSEV